MLLCKSGRRAEKDHRICLSLSPTVARAGVAQWIGHQPVNQRVTGSIPSQGTCLGCRPGPQVGDAQEATTHGCFFASFSCSLPLSLKINK